MGIIITLVSYKNEFVDQKWNLPTRVHSLLGIHQNLSETKLGDKAAVAKSMFRNHDFIHWKVRTPTADAIWGNLRMKANISFIFTYIYQVSKVYPRTRPKIPRSIYLRLYRLSSASLGLAHKSCLRRQDRNSDLHVDVSKWPLCLIAHKPCLQARRAEPEGNRYPTVTPSLNCDSVHLKTYPAHLTHHLISCFLTTFARPQAP